MHCSHTIFHYLFISCHMWYMEIERETREIDQIELFPVILDFPWKNSQFGKTRSFPERKLSVSLGKTRNFPERSLAIFLEKTCSFPGKSLTWENSQFPWKSAHLRKLVILRRMINEHFAFSAAKLQRKKVLWIISIIISMENAYKMSNIPQFSINEWILWIEW